MRSLGYPVVLCAAKGEVVNDRYGADGFWDYPSIGGYSGYVSDEYVNTQGDIDDRSKVPLC